MLEVSKRLQKKGWKVIVISELHDASLLQKDVYEGIAIYRIPVSKNEKEKKYQIWNWLFSHRSLLRKAKLVHCHDVFYWYAPFRFLFPFKKVYMTFHGYEGDSLPSRKAVFMHKIAESLSNGAICVGDYLKKWYGTKPDFVTYGAIVLPRKEEERVKKIREIVFIGRLDPEAGILRYLQLLNILKQQGFLPHLSVLGGGILSEEAKIYVRRHRLNVTFYGAVADINDFVSRADCVFTSRFLSTLESFAYRKYVFCLYNNAIHRDCFRLAPFYSWMDAEGSIEKMAENVKTLIAHPNSHDEDIDHAYNWVKQQSWEKVTKLYMALWKIQ